MWVFRALLPALLALIVPAALPAAAGTIPLDSPLYETLESLEVRGLLPSGHLTTRPIREEEALRLFEEADANMRSLPIPLSPAEAASLRQALERLKNNLRRSEEIHGDITLQSVTTETAVRTFNRLGDELEPGENLRFQGTSRKSFGNTLALQIRPEYRGTFGEGGGDAEERGTLLEGFGVFTWRKLEITGGRQALGWGPGSHGALLISDNARPFDLIKVSAADVVTLPWFLRILGPLKPTFFWTRLEADRGDFPHAQLMGLRLDFRTAPAFRFGLSRIIQFGGEGRKSISAKDWIKILLAQDTVEHGYAGRDLDNNQLLSLDASLIFPHPPAWLPFSAVKFYDEWGFEDSSGNGTPTDQAHLAGFLASDPFGISGLLWRGEYAATAHSRSPASWYTHGVYGDGYTYYDRIIGHAMGGDAEDFYIRLAYPATADFSLSLDGSLTRIGVHRQATTISRRIGLGGRHRLSWGNVAWEGIFESVENPDFTVGETDRGVRLQWTMSRTF